MHEGENNMVKREIKDNGGRGGEEEKGTRAEEENQKVKEKRRCRSC